MTIEMKQEDAMTHPRMRPLTTEPSLDDVLQAATCHLISGRLEYDPSRYLYVRDDAPPTRWSGDYMGLLWLTYVGLVVGWGGDYFPWFPDRPGLARKFLSAILPPHKARRILILEKCIEAGVSSEGDVKAVMENENSFYPYSSEDTPLHTPVEGLELSPASYLHMSWDLYGTSRALRSSFLIQWLRHSKAPSRQAVAIEMWLPDGPSDDTQKERSGGSG